MKKTVMFLAAVAVILGTLAGTAVPAHAHDVCRAEGFVPYYDSKTYVATADGTASCTQLQRVVALWVDAEGFMANEWRTRGEAQRAWNDAYGGYWKVDTTCAPGKRNWRTKAFVSAQQQISSVSFRNDQDTHYSGTRYMECGGNGGLPLIDPPN